MARGRTDSREKLEKSTSGKLKTDLPLSAFGDLRVIELSPIFQISFEYTVTNTRVGTVTETNSGTVTQATAMCVAGTGTTTASVAEWESVSHVKYRSGFGGTMRFTALFTTGVAGTEQVVGLADENGSSASHKNGYAIGYNGTVFSYMRWQNDALFATPITAWTHDRLDGSGGEFNRSGMTLDPTKLNVFFIQFQYLGAGAISIWVEDQATGEPILAHRELYANLNIVPSCYNPNFHMMVHAQNAGTTDDLIIKTASMGYLVEGKSEHLDRQQPTFSTGTIEKTTVTSEVAILTLRVKAAYASKTNFLDMVLTHLSASIEASAANNLGNLRLVKNTTLGGTPSYADISTTDSIMDIDTAGTTLTGGTELLSVPLAGKNDRLFDNLVPFEFIFNPGDTITLAAASANSATVDGSLLWKELL